MWRHYRPVPEYCDRSAIERGFDVAWRIPFDAESGKIIAMKKTLQLIFRKLAARGLSHTNVYIANRRMMKFLAADKYCSRHSSPQSRSPRACPSMTRIRLPYRVWRISLTSSFLSFPRLSEADPHHHSHSIVPGGFEVMSYTTRFTPRTSFTIRFEIVFSTSYGSETQSAVIPSSECTARTAHV
jgi:hypothetical protein